MVPLSYVRLVAFLGAFAALTAWTAPAMANGPRDCDCNTPQGSCSFSVNHDKEKHTYEISAPTCQRMTVYVDGSPYMNVLSGGQTVRHEVMVLDKTKPYTVTAGECTVCELKRDRVARCKAAAGPIDRCYTPGIVDCMQKYADQVNSCVGAKSAVFIEKPDGSLAINYYPY